MTVCRFYLQGTCRFGDRCRFEHVDPDYTEDYSYDNSNRKQDYGYQDRYRQQGSHQYRNNKYEQDLSFGPRRNDGYDRQNQRYETDRYNQADSYRSNAKHNQSYRYDSPDRNNQRYESERYSNQKQNTPETYNRYSNQKQITSETYNTNTRFDGFHRQPQKSDYHSPKYDRNQYEWVSEDYKRRQQAGGSLEDTPMNKINLESRVQFSFKDPESEVKKDSTNEKTLLLADIIKEDMTAWELGNQWPLTCYYPFPDKEGFPGFIDISPEELRFEAVKAEENNSFNTYVASIEKQILDVHNRRNQLKEPSGELLSVMEKLRLGELLGDEPEVKGGFSFPQFNQPSTVAAHSFFPSGNAATSFSFKTVLDGESTAKSTASSFSFKLPENEKLPVTLSTGVDNSDTNIYTPLDKLSEIDKQQFTASTFTLGKIPTVPPPQMMCF